MEHNVDEQAKNSLAEHTKLPILCDAALPAVQIGQEERVPILGHELRDASFPPSLSAPSVLRTSTEICQKQKHSLSFEQQELATVTDFNENCGHAIMTAGPDSLPRSPFRSSILSTMMTVGLTPQRIATSFSSPQRAPHQQCAEIQDETSSKQPVVGNNSQDHESSHIIIEVQDVVTSQSGTGTSQQIHERRQSTQPANIETRAMPPLVTTTRTWASEAHSYWSFLTSYATPTTITVAVIMPILFISCMWLL